MKLSTQNRFLLTNYDIKLKLPPPYAAIQNRYQTERYNKPSFTGHPNVKAFISHGGLLGTTEAVHCGVPAIVMPQFGDQYTNAKALEASGGGVVLDFSSMQQEDVDNALRTVLAPRWVHTWVLVLRRRSKRANSGLEGVETTDAK